MSFRRVNLSFVSTVPRTIASRSLTSIDLVLESLSGSKYSYLISPSKIKYGTQLLPSNNKIPHSPRYSRFFMSVVSSDNNSNTPPSSSSSLSASKKQPPLRIAIVMGSVRQGPPKPSRLCERVVKHCAQDLERRGHVVDIIDPAEDDLYTHRQPHFTYPGNRIPSVLARVHQIFLHADAYVMVSPEYNHSMSPALASTLNLFGSSVFSFKPSAIVSYSAGQWGGARAAMALRPFLSELGCIPVSAMIHIPEAQKKLTEDGEVMIPPVFQKEEADTVAGTGQGSKQKQDDEPLSRWRKYTARTWSQLEFWACAAREQKKLQHPFADSPAFLLNPEQRNAP